MKAKRRSNPIGRLSFVVALATSLVCSHAAKAALIINGALPITERVNVHIIQVADNGGANAAPLWGSASETSDVFAKVNQIWAQAGIDVAFTSLATTYNSTFALTGTSGGNNPRPTSDLGTILTNATAAGGILSANPLTLNLFVTRIVPGFSQTSDNTSNGLAFVGANGITYWAGPNLTSFEAGREVLASVLSHEIGHNLNLDHILSSENLMQAGGSPNPGQRLNSSKIMAALSSPFSVVIPVPESSRAVAAVLLISTASCLLLRRRVAG